MKKIIHRILIDSNKLKATFVGTDVRSFSIIIGPPEIN